MQPAATESPLFLFAMCLLALGPLAWMARAWVREWQDYRAGTLTPHHRDRPPVPTLHQPWRRRMLLVYAAQAAAIGWIVWSIFTNVDPGRDPEAAKGLALVLPFAIIVVAFATAVLTRLWDLSRAAIARRRSTGRQGQ